MRHWLAVGFCLLASLNAVGSPEAGSASFPASAGIVLPTGAVESPELTQRLESLRTIRWISSGACRVDAPLVVVRDHLRREQKRSEEKGVGQPRGRLREWLDRNPAEMTKYREYERAQTGGAPSVDWEVATIPAAEIPFSLGGGETFRRRRFVARTAEMAFGAIVLPDSVVRIQLLSPAPSDDGGELVNGTLVAWIRELREESSAPTRAAETIDGPETAGLAVRVRGWLVMDEPVGGMVALGVPVRSPSWVRAPGRSTGVVHSLSGPDSRGRIAYVENRAGEGRHSLRTVLVDGSGDDVVFSRPGETFFEMAVGASLALSPTGARIALLSRLSRFQTNRPSFPLRIGTLEIWELEKKSGRAIDLFPLDRRLSWFPDGRRLAYVELVPLSKVSFRNDGAADRFGDAFRSWEAVPVVKVLDVDTDRRAALHVGWDPVVSSDGKSVLLRDSENHWRQVEVESGRSRPVAWPGDAGGAIALTGDGLVVYWGLPTSGSAPEFTRSYSALGPRPMKTIKVAELSSQRFETLLPSLDPRRDVSFGFTTR